MNNQCIDVANQEVATCSLRRMAVRALVSALLMSSSGVLVAQELTFDQMKSELNEKSLPLVNLTVDVASLNKTTYVEGEIEIVDYQQRTEPGEESVTYACELRYRGAMAAAQQKKSFAVKLYNEKGKDLDANIFGIREENSWILDAMAIDRLRMRNRVCFDVWNEISRTPYETSYDDRNGTEGVFVEVFINGDYNGLYCMTDKIDRKLLGLKKAKEDDEGLVTIKGLLYKGDSWGSSDNLLSYEEDEVDQDTWNIWELQYPDDYPSIDTWQPLMDLIDFCSSQTTDEAFAQEYEEYFFADNLIDYVVFTLGMNVGDNAYKNTFLSTVDITSGHRYMITPWDMDMSLGGHCNGEYNDTLASLTRYNNIGPFNRLIPQNIDGFFDRVSMRMLEFQQSVLSVDSIFHRLDAYASLFTESGAWEREIAKWDGIPVPLKETIAEEVDYVKDWYVRNFDHLHEHFDTSVGIEDVATDNVTHTIYSLYGDRLPVDNPSSLLRGIYIVNGKKIMIK